MNDDGLADILTFVQGTGADVYVAFATGSAFGPGALWDSYFAPAGEWPSTGDFDADGLTDIVAFTRRAAADVFVVTSNGWLFGPARYGMAISARSARRMGAKLPVTPVGIAGCQTR